MSDPSGFCLVHFNLAIAREALDHQLMADFVQQIEAINQLASKADGFVWMAEGGDAEAIFGNPRALPNMTLWQSLDDLRKFTYAGPHAAALRRRAEWFLPPVGPSYVLWWTPQTERPSLAEAKKRLEILAEHGPTPAAFTFGQAFAPPT